MRLWTCPEPTIFVGMSRLIQIFRHIRDIIIMAASFFALSHNLMPEMPYWQYCGMAGFYKKDRLHGH